jgi:3-oxoacyl-[acyl-carrier-protein] synthase II
VERIVITGMGILSSVGVGREAFWYGLREGFSGIRPLSLFDAASSQSRLVGEIADFSPAPYLGTKGIRHFDRTTLLLASAAKLAMEDARIDDAFREEEIGIAVGSTYGSISSIAAFDTDALKEGPTYVNPMQFPNTVLNAPASRVSILMQIKGPNATISTAETSSLDAIGYATDFLRLERAKGMLAGGTFGLSEELFWAFSGTGALSGSNGGEEICAPFDRRRNGLVLGEGSCLFFLEPLAGAIARGARIYGEVSGYASAFQPRKGHPVAGARRMINAALESAGRRPQDVSCIFAGANSTQLGDRLEVGTFHSVFGEGEACPPVSAIKSMCGECLDASGALQAAAALLALNEHVVPPTINYQEKDDECDIDCVPNVCRQVEVRNALLTGFAYTGNSSALLLSSHEGN